MTRSVDKMYVGAGIILAKKDSDGEYRFLLLKGRIAGVWSFSKGHPEDVDGRSPLCTAARETYEETGLSAGEDYTIYGNSIRFGKRPYWVGIMKDDAKEVRLSHREHSGYAWMTWGDVTQIRGNMDVRSWVQKAHKPAGEFRRLLAISSETI